MQGKTARLALVMLLAVAAAMPLQAAEIASLHDAQQLATERGVPLLLDFYTDW
jgi:hypothetical protein